MASALEEQTYREATWENAIEIQSQFPTFCLEDKVVFAEGNIDRNQSEVYSAQEGSIHSKAKPKILQVYSRRPRQVTREG